MATRKTTARKRTNAGDGKGLSDAKAKLAMVYSIRTAASELQKRSALANAMAGVTYGGKRDLYEALGYKRRLFPADYRDRFNRNAVAARIVEAKPQSTWRGGGVIIEDEAPDIETPFEKAWEEMNRRLNIWQVFEQADILAGLGYYAIILIGAPGDLDKPLKKCKPEEVVYLQPYSQADAPVQKWDNDPKSARFGQPVMYTLARANPSTYSPIMVTSEQVGNNRTSGRPVHYSRVIHIADGMLDDRVNGIPRLERCWNLLDDLDKVTGGGAEAFWRRADAGLQVDVDPEMELVDEDEEQLDEEIDDYIHGLRRVVRTRGVKMTPLTSAVAGIKDPIDGIMSQLSAGTGIPQRILMGSERGQLASTQDDDNWTARITDRRKAYAGPVVVIPTINRLISIGALPTPKEEYNPRWPEIDNLDDVQKAQVAKDWANINKDMGETVVLPDEIRDRLLGLPPLEDVATPDQLNGVIEGEVVEDDQRALPTAAQQRRLARFKQKWACLSLRKKRLYLQRRLPNVLVKILPRQLAIPATPVVEQKLIEAPAAQPIEVTVNVAGDKGKRTKVLKRDADGAIVETETTPIE